MGCSKIDRSRRSRNVESLAECIRVILLMRKPIVVEFAGVPKAGKTSTLNHVYAFLRRCGFKCEVGLNVILNWVSESIEENILSAPRVSFELQNKFVAGRETAEQLLNTFEKEGTFLPRKRVEADQTRIQPLPIVVVRNRSGSVLRLVRNEREATNRLHKKITVWAGGHVHREDGPNGLGSIINGARRELQEELRIQAGPERLKLLGAVYIPTNGSTQKHMAFVYEWRAESDDVEVALCNAEFMEKQGTSLQGQFLSPEEISQEADGLEEWSKEILSTLLSPQHQTDNRAGR
jgi:predicted NUDIX family phosphoesterase